MHVNKKLKEIKAHGTRMLPLEVYKDDCRVYGAIYTHWHKEYEIIFITAGTGKLWINKKSYALKKGNIILIGSEELHYIESNKKDILAFESIVFNQSIINEKDLEIFYAVLKNVITEKDEFYFDMKKLISDIVQVYFDASLHYSLLIKSYLLQLIYLSLKGNYLKEIVKNERTSNVVMKEICDFIHRNYQFDLKSKKLAEMAGYSKFHFTKIFKEYTGKSVLDYIHHLRMDRALSLLMNTNLTVEEVAFDLGYENVSYFIKRFKSLTGKSPSKYKNENQIKQNCDNK